MSLHRRSGRRARLRWPALLIPMVAAAIAVPSAHAAPVTCPTAMPLSEVAAAASTPAGFEAHGKTVSRGNSIDDFDVTVLGVLKDGVAVGKDMIIVNVHDYPVMDNRAHGIWAGMSGSPVYANDGRLIGAVAFGLSFGPSTIAGVTPAEDMLDVLGMPQSAAPQRSVRAPSSLQHRMVATGAVTAQQASSRFRQLQVPLAISGLNGSRLDALANRLPGHERFVPFQAGSAGLAAGPGDPSAIVDGGNFAAAFSYGDVMAAGVGTTTAVCSDKVVAFGHPMFYDGPTALSAHTADAITIQDDSLGAPYKLANIGGFVGTVDQDRGSGIRTFIGAPPTPVVVTSRITNDGGPVDDGETDINRTIDSPDIAAAHLLGDIDSAIDRVGAGRLALAWTVAGTAGGEQFSLTRSNKFADSEDISVNSVQELFGMLDTIVRNPFADVKLRSVDITASVQSQFRQYEITGLQQRVGSTWVPVEAGDSITLTPGVPLRVRVLLQDFRNSAAVAPVELRFPVAADASGDGSLDITGGADAGGDDDGAATASADDEEATSFKGLLTTLGEAPRNDDLAGSLSWFGGGGDGSPLPLDASGSTPTTVKKRLAEVVAGSLSVPVTIPGQDDPEPGPSPAFSISGKASARLAAALKKGLRLTARADAPGRLKVKVTVDKKTARRLKLKKHAKGPVVVASLAKAIEDGRSHVTVRFTRTAKRRLKRASRVRLSVSASLTAADGNRSSDRAKMLLTRKKR